MPHSSSVWSLCDSRKLVENRANRRRKLEKTSECLDSNFAHGRKRALTNHGIALYLWPRTSPTLPGAGRDLIPRDRSQREGRDALRAQHNKTCALQRVESNSSVKNMTCLKLRLILQEQRILRCPAPVSIELHVREPARPPFGSVVDHARDPPALALWLAAGSRPVGRLESSKAALYWNLEA